MTRPSVVHPWTKVQQWCNLAVSIPDRLLNFKPSDRGPVIARPAQETALNGSEVNQSNLGRPGDRCDYAGARAGSKVCRRKRRACPGGHTGGTLPPTTRGCCQGLLADDLPGRVSSESDIGANLAGDPR